MFDMFHIYKRKLSELPVTQKLLINTINAYSYNVSQIDPEFQEALVNSDVLIPDGVSVVLALLLLNHERIKKIAGADLFYYEMERLEQNRGKCFFLGSTEATLEKIQKRAYEDYPNVKIATYSPPFKPVFSAEDNTVMLERINTFKPDVLFIGMTAPKQEKWAYTNFNQLLAKHVCSVGAVFDFYARIISRAPTWMIRMGLEWLYRLLKEPHRMWKRYLIGNCKFIKELMKNILN